LGLNVLNIARSANPLGFYRYLPPVVKAFNPAIWLEHDKAYGLALSGNLSFNLHQFSESSPGKTANFPKTALNLYAEGSKALNQPYYTTRTSLTFLSNYHQKNKISAGGELQYNAHQEPQAEWIFNQQSVHLRGQTFIPINKRYVNQLSLGAGYRRATNQLVNSREYTPQRTPENAFEARTIGEGYIARGFIRGALWFDAATLKNNSADYRRLVGKLGYARQFYLANSSCKIEKAETGPPSCVFPAQNPPALGLELLLQAGQAWGNIPPYARFFGGNHNQNFLFGSQTHSTFSLMPAGPLIRSFGRNEAALKPNAQTTAGGTTYWNVNVGLSLPWPRLSRPLIPAETVTSRLNNTGQLSCDSCSTLKDVLKNQVAGGKNVFIDALAFKKLTAAQQQDLNLSVEDSLTQDEDTRRLKAETAFAQARAEVISEANKIWQELTPTITYIADRANIFALKPIILADVAKIYAPETQTEKTRVALGGGLQLNIVVARFEAAYLHTVRYLPGDSRRNFVFRMVFDRFN
jgi:hypothetical protein